MNKTLKYIVLLAIACFVGKASAQELKSEVFSLLNLDYPGLEKVKALHQEGKDEDAAKALLDYYRARTNVKTPDINLNKVTISKEEQQWADDGLKNTFFVHKGYQPSYNYGEDINWQYWPVKDNELRWQLHRHKWFTPMGKAYRISGDEKYAKEWAHQYIDWIKKNPLVKMNKKEKRAALKSVLTSRVQENKFLVVDELKFDEIKTKKMQGVLDALKVKKALVVLKDNDQNVLLSARNIADVKTARTNTINVFDILKYNTVVLDKAAVAKVEEVYA